MISIIFLIYQISGALNPKTNPEDEIVVKFFRDNDLLEEGNLKNISTKKLEEGMKISNFSAFVRNNIKEEDINSSKIEYSMISLKKNKIEPIKLYSDNIKKGDFADYIVSSAYMPLLIGYDKSNPWMIPMLEKIGCEKIAVNVVQHPFRKIPQ